MQSYSIALVPAYEPEHALIDLLFELKLYGFKIIVVDDGSGPSFADVFQTASTYATVLHHAENRGKGCALKTGFSHIQGIAEPDSVIVTVDADGQHRAEDAAKLCDAAHWQPDTLFLGSRRLERNVPLRSQFGNTVTRLVYRLSTGLNVRDTQTGLRAFSTMLLPELLRIPGERYEYEMNVLLEFARRKIPIAEMEVETIYIDNNSSSHFHTLRDSCRIYKEILKFSASSFAGFLVDYAMYSLLLFITADLRFSNIVARIVSASVNYSLNRKFVFRSRDKALKSALEYFLLAVAILVGNTLVLEVLVERIGAHQMFAKLLTELLFFFISWSIQRFFIFRKDGGR